MVSRVMMHIFWWSRFQFNFDPDHCHSIKLIPVLLNGIQQDGKWSQVRHGYEAQDYEAEAKPKLWSNYKAEAEALTFLKYETEAEAEALNFSKHGAEAEAKAQVLPS